MEDMFNIDWLGVRIDEELAIVYCYKIYDEIKDYYYIGQTTVLKRNKIYNRHRLHMKGTQMVDKFLRTHEYRYCVLWIGYKEDANAMERWFIKNLSTIYPRGLNLDIGGNNAPMSDESRKKCSISQKERYKKNPARKGVIFSKLHKQHISETHWMRGKKCEGEYWVKLYNSCPNKKAIMQIDPSTNEIVRIWPSIKEAKRELGYASTGCIRDCLHGRQKTSHGYVWKFVNPDDA